VNEGNTSNIQTQTYSNKTGDEASVLKLSLTLEVQSLIVNKSSLTQIIVNEMKNKVSEGYIMTEDQIDFKFEPKKGDDKSKDYVIDVTANLVPSVDKEDLAKKIRGKYVSAATETLEQNVPGYSGVEVKMKPSLPGKLKTLPHVTGNIQLDLSSER
jgi:hypothetical protein